MNPRIAAVVVTYNRKALLRRCLDAIASQSRSPESVLIIDNSSTDGTRGWLYSWLPSNIPHSKLIELDDNRGGAGGFSEGLRLAIEDGADWIWMMDDDAEPHASALAELMLVAKDPRNIYGSLATSGRQTSWRMMLLGDPPLKTDNVEDIPEQALVQALPFLGFLIHRNLVARIGLPDPGFFIAADDVEYCVRAQRAGARIIVAGKSHIEHPKSEPYEVRLLCYTLTALKLPPWKRYYDTRNRLLIARRYYGAALFTRTIPGSFVRLFAALLKEPGRRAQVWAWFCGMVDGLRGKVGRRHHKWGIE